MKEIKELDDKYLVLKWKDINSALDAPMHKQHFRNLIKEIQHHRELNGKKDNKYLVLNRDDEFNINILVDAIEAYRRHMTSTNLKVSDIAVAFVNAILKAKEKT